MGLIFNSAFLPYYWVVLSFFCILRITFCLKEVRVFFFEFRVYVSTLNQRLYMRSSRNLFLLLHLLFSAIFDHFTTTIKVIFLYLLLQVDTTQNIWLTKRKILFSAILKWYKRSILACIMSIIIIHLLSRFIFIRMRKSDLSLFLRKTAIL